MPCTSPPHPPRVGGLTPPKGSVATPLCILSKLASSLEQPHDADHVTAHRVMCRRVMCIAKRAIFTRTPLFLHLSYRQ